MTVPWAARPRATPEEVARARRAGVWSRCSCSARCWCRSPRAACSWSASSAVTPPRRCSRAVSRTARRALRRGLRPAVHRPRRDPRGVRAAGRAGRPGRTGRARGRLPAEAGRGRGAGQPLRGDLGRDVTELSLLYESAGRRCVWIGFDQPQGPTEDHPRGRPLPRAWRRRNPLTPDGWAGAVRGPLLWSPTTSSCRRAPSGSRCGVTGAAGPSAARSGPVTAPVTTRPPGHPPLAPGTLSHVFLTPLSAASTPVCSREPPRPA